MSFLWEGEQEQSLTLWRCDEGIAKNTLCQRCFYGGGGGKEEKEEEEEEEGEEEEEEKEKTKMK